MNNLVLFDKPLKVEDAVAHLPDMSRALSWGVQSLVKETVRSMILLATSLSEHYRYELALTDDIAQYLYDMPEGAVTASEHFIRCNQDGTVIGHFDAMSVHVIQEKSEPDQQAMMLLILNDDRLVVGYLLTRLREYADHVVINNILPKSKVAE